MRFFFIFWYLLSVAIFLVLNDLFSISIYNTTKLFFPFVITLIATFFVFLGLFKVNKWSDFLFLNFNAKENNSGLKFIILFVVMLFGVAISNNLLDKRVEQALLKEGIVVKARIKDGQQVHNKSAKSRAEKFYLDLFFITNAGLECDFRTEVTSDIFENAYKDLKVDVVYLESDPSVFKVLLNDENIKRYTKIENKNLQFQDLLKFTSLPDNKKFLFLKKISGGWDTKVEDFGRIYFNLLKKEAVVIYYSNSKIILYQSENKVENNYFFGKINDFTTSKVAQNKLQSNQYISIANLIDAENFIMKNCTVEKTKIVVESSVVTNFLIVKN